MAAGYFISFAENGASNCQTTGSTQIFLTNSSASFANPDQVVTFFGLHLM
jgi:hypothetical protein